MNIAGLRLIGSAVLLVLLAGTGCNRPKRTSSESNTAPTPQGFARASPRTRRMHSTIHRLTCRTSLAHYCGASRSKT